jgi:D-methionine transport system ATP-binding protein
MNMAVLRNAATSAPQVLPVDKATMSTTTNPMVAFERVSKRFAAGKTGAEVVALDDIELLVPRGSVTGIIGRSGAGKSTLIRLVNGLEKPSSGRVVVDGVDLSGVDEKNLRAVRRSIGMIFQHFNLLSSRTAFGNVALPLEIAGMGRQEIENRVGPLLDLVGLADKRGRYPSELSGGQKQRIGIARALATEPKLLLSDEATSALDPETTRSILALLRKINKELGLTVLLITHEMEVVKAIADHVAVIDGGRIVEKGPTFDVFTGHAHETTRALLGGLAGMHLPEFLTSRMSPQPEPGSRTIVRVIFKGENATEPMLARLGSELGIEVNIMAGAVDEIAGRPFGMLVVSLRADEVKIAAARQFLATHGLSSEVVGYVR